LPLLPRKGSTYGIIVVNFKVTITDPAHPVMQGFTDKFPAVDEVWANMEVHNTI
jgi:hypothetical protein